MKRLLVIGFVAVFVVCFAASVSFAADMTNAQGGSKAGTVKNVVTVPAKTAAPSAKAVTPAPVTSTPEAAKQPPEKTEKEMTGAELASSISTIANTNGELFGAIPGLLKERDSSGKTFYTYNGKKLEELDRGTLEKLFSRTQSEIRDIRRRRAEAIRKRTETTNRQMVNLKRIQNTQNAIKRSNTQLPKAPRPPSVPRTYKAY